MKKPTPTPTPTKARKKANPAELVAQITRAKRILLTGHVRPDGDSLGCMIALASLLNQAGINAVGTADPAALGGPGFLKGSEWLIPPEAAAGRAFDLLISLDCGAFERLPELIQPLAAKLPVINIDHHCTNTLFGALNWIDARASSTAELVWRLARKARWPLDTLSAEALWVALITDSGRFAYDKTTPATLRCGADLLRHGVRTAFINDKLYCSFSRVSIELKKRAYRTLVVSDDQAVASVTLTGKDFDETGGNKADAEDVIEIPRSLIGNRVAVFFYGNEDDHAETRVSVRTRDPLDATQLVTPFGGGGHSRAAGCTIKAPLAQAKKLFFKAIDDLLKAPPITAST
ncbi:MAG: bifunctional oligoribonuclease/PAP phosphatase NrnA [Verrucomicrobiota bacterium]|jgi:phosphoesterase RecJ-like protein|nr:bifunctional oligoribonuclease/PAP phosphatase NrnA [Verrucomicrobiota bacterium]